jgi:DNA excision repair protein ERCC-2
MRDSAPGLPLRVLELTARDKACEHPDKACHGDSCPLARGFYDRLPAARSESSRRACMDGRSLAQVALKHQVCPYYLTQELARWADFIVGDYNYYFDGSAMLHAMTLATSGGSACWRTKRTTSSSGPAPCTRPRSARPPCAACARRRRRRCVGAGQGQSRLDALRKASKPRRGQARCAAGVLHHGAQASRQRDGNALRRSGARRQPTDRCSRPTSTSWASSGWPKSFGPHSVLEWTDRPAGAGKPAATLRIQNLIPAPFLKPRFAAARTVTLFSATLSPPRYYMDMLGLPESTAWIDVESPFSPDQLKVQVVSRISTRFPDRQRSAAPIARLIADQFAAQAGNYLAFFSSFDYLALVAAEFQQRYPEVPMWTQERGMDEGARKDFLDRFAPGGAGVGFAVLGGSFGEGIDLRGDRLVGAFVATLGLPQVNPRNEQLKACLEGVFGAGYDYTYLYPGIQKVVQAAGRVIRTQEDKGVVYLIDDRFARPAVRELLPAWWRITSAGSGAPA